MTWQNCLICLTNLEDPEEPPPIEEAEEKITVTENEGGASAPGASGNCWEKVLGDNLKVIFLLKNLFEVPNEKLEHYLENFGNPASWGRLCAKCQKLVEEARENWLTVLKAIKQFVEIRSKVIREVGKRSTVSDDLVSRSGAVNYTICEDLRNIVNCGDYSKVSIKYPFHSEKSLAPDKKAFPLVSPKQEVIYDDFNENEEVLDPLSIDNAEEEWHPGPDNEEDNEEDNYYEENLEQEEEEEIIDESCDSDDYSPLRTSQSKRRRVGRPSKKNLKEKLTCKFCEKRFPNAHGLSVHIGRSHPGKDTNDKEKSKEIKVERYVCEMDGCGKEFTWKQSYVQHMAKHRDGRKFKCDICGKGFFRKAALQYHLGAHKRKSIASKKFTPLPKRDEKTQKILCTVDGCGMEFSWSQSYKMHMKKHESQPMFDCEQCGRKFFRNSSLKYHLEAHKRNTIPATLDEDTPKMPGRPPRSSLKKEEDLDPSAKILDEEIIPRDNPDDTENFGEETLVCSVKGCGKVYLARQRRHFKWHMARHFKETRFRCLICGKEFYKKDNFLYHKKSHKRKGDVIPMKRKPEGEDLSTTADNPEGKDVPPKYQCEFCGEEFPKKGHLTCHVRMHKGPLPKRDYFVAAGAGGGLSVTSKHVCDLCGKTFKRLSYLRKHKREIHEGRWPLFCEICGKGMAARQHLRLHMRNSHKIFEEGVKLFKCLVEGCRKKFFDEGRYEEHMKELHPKGVGGGDPMPFSCEICGRGVWSFTKLTVHLKTHKYVEGKRSRNIVVKE